MELHDLHPEKLKVSLGSWLRLQWLQHHPGPGSAAAAGPRGPGIARGLGAPQPADAPPAVVALAPRLPDRPQEKGRVFRESFISKLALLLRGTVAAPPERFGETLADEHIRGGAFVGPDSKPVIVNEQLPNSHMRLFGGAQYHRAMAEFRAGARRGRGGARERGSAVCRLGGSSSSAGQQCADAHAPPWHAPPSALPAPRHRYDQLPRHLARGDCERVRH